MGYPLCVFMEPARTSVFYVTFLLLCCAMGRAEEGSWCTRATAPRKAIEPACILWHILLFVSGVLCGVATGRVEAGKCGIPVTHPPRIAIESAWTFGRIPLSGTAFSMVWPQDGQRRGYVVLQLHTPIQMIEPAPTSGEPCCLLVLPSFVSTPLSD